jgi:hypothetical protein
MSGIKKGRKFHDAWAFLLYVVFTTVAMALIMSTGENRISLSSGNADVPAYIVNGGILASFMTFNILAFKFFAEFYIHACNLALPILSFGLVLFFAFSNLIMVLVCGLISALSLVFYFLFIRNNVKYVAALARNTTNVILKNFLGLFFAVLVCASILFLQSLLFNAIAGGDAGRKDLSMLHILLVLSIFWSLMNVYYFFVVFVSGMVIAHFIEADSNERVSVLRTATANALYSLGSVCFGGLVVAVVQTLRYVVENQRRPDRGERREANLLGVIMLCIAACLLALLEDIIRFANDLAFPYLALHGTGYKDSVRQSFELISSTSSLPVVNMIALRAVVGVTLASFILFVAGGSTAAVLLWKGVLSSMILYAAVLSVMVFALFIQVYICGGAACIYTFIEMEDVVERVEPELAAILRNKRIEA